METSTEGTAETASGDPGAAAEPVVVEPMAAAVVEGAGEVSRPAMAPASLSPSRASDFMQCPLLYRFRVIDRLPEKPSEAATRGTLVHSVLERLFDALLPPSGPRRRPSRSSLVSGTGSGRVARRWSSCSPTIRTASG